MTNDVAPCVIGCFDNYGWSRVRAWAESLVSCGYLGDKVAICRASTEGCAQELRQLGFEVVRRNDDPSCLPHIERFLWIYDFLSSKRSLGIRYPFVVTTDVRDVVFQRDPVGFWTDLPEVPQLVVGSEGVRLKDEEWGRANLAQAFSDRVYNYLSENEVFNVGVLGGSHAVLEGLALLIYKLAAAADTPIADQAALNFLLGCVPIPKGIKVVGPDHPWVCHVGVAFKSVTQSDGQDVFLYPRPRRNAERIVTADGVPYCIVHQYDRLPRPLMVETAAR